MNVDTGQFRAIVDERDQLAAELPEIRGYMVMLADAMLRFGDYALAGRAPAPAPLSRRDQGRHARPRERHLRLVQGGQR